MTCSLISPAILLFTNNTSCSFGCSVRYRTRQVHTEEGVAERAVLGRYQSSRAPTINAAGLLGKTGKVGVVEKGYCVDIIAVRGIFVWRDALRLCRPAIFPHLLTMIRARATFASP
jgi:hypothetical protein